jgi:hypothetical protein
MSFEERKELVDVVLLLLLLYIFFQFLGSKCNMLRTYSTKLGMVSPIKNVSLTDKRKKETRGNVCREILKFRRKSF